MMNHHENLAWAHGELVVEISPMLDLPIERTTRWKYESDLKKGPALLLHPSVANLTTLAGRRCSHSEDS